MNRQIQSINNNHVIIEVYPASKTVDSTHGLGSGRGPSQATNTAAPAPGPGPGIATTSAGTRTSVRSPDRFGTYIPLIGDLDGTLSQSGSSKSSKLRPGTCCRVGVPNLAKTGQNQPHHEQGSPFACAIFFRRCLDNYSYPTKIQSWTEFLDTSRMKTPISPNQLMRRVTKNLAHFQANYLFIFSILFIYCVLTSPLLLLAIALVCGVLYFVTVINHESLSRQDGRPLNILGIEPTLQQQYTAITVISLPLLWVSGAPAALFWVVGASFFAIGLHSTIYAIEVDRSNDAIGRNASRSRPHEARGAERSNVMTFGEVLDI